MPTEEMPSNQPSQAEGPSRRTLLKRAGVVGAATLWAAPMVQSLGMRGAAAATGSPPPGQTGSISGQVTDATNSNPIAGATVIINGTALSTTTDNSGNYSFSNVPAGSQSLTASFTGYLPSTQTTVVPSGGTATLNFALVTTGSGTIRAVLSWGATPRDLDLHMSGPLADGVPGRFHVAFFNKQQLDASNSVYVQQDVDDVNGNGPETDSISVSTSEGDYVAGNYHVWVHNYSDEADFDASDATVTLFGLSGQIASYHQSGASGLASQLIWKVVDFDVDHAGNVSNVTAVQAMDNGSSGDVF